MVWLTINITCMKSEAEATRRSAYEEMSYCARRIPTVK